MDASAAQFLDPKYYNLPNLGQLYGGSGTLNLEQIAATGAQIVIDVGEIKANMTTDLDNLQKQLGIRWFTLTDIPPQWEIATECWAICWVCKKRLLFLAQYCDKIYADTLSISNRVGASGKANLLYVVGTTGLNVIAKGSYHAEVIDLLSTILRLSIILPAVETATR